jgi:hypothetical protein
MYAGYQMAKQKAGVFNAKAQDFTDNPDYQGPSALC